MMIGQSLIVLFMFAYQILMIIVMSNPRAGIPAFEKENVAEISAREQENVAEISVKGKENVAETSAKEKEKGWDSSKFTGLRIW